jgi:hypothetical protein
MISCARLQNLSGHGPLSGHQRVGYSVRRLALAQGGDKNSRHISDGSVLWRAVTTTDWVGQKHTYTMIVGQIGDVKRIWR